MKRMMLWPVSGFAALLLVSLACPAAQTVAIYTQGVAAVDDVGTFQLNVGVNHLSFSVPSLLVPESVHVDVDGTIVSQTFSYTPEDSLLSASVGKRVQVVSQDGRVFLGTLLSTGNPITLRDETGRIEFLYDVAQVTLLDASLSTLPVLDVVVERSAAGLVPVGLHYLTGGLSWEASYVAVLDPQGTSLSLNAGIYLTNRSGMDFPAASVRLVAGQLNLGTSGSTDFALAPKALAASSVTEQAAFEYHVYSLSAPLDLRDGTSFLVPYLASPSVAVEKEYTYDGARASGVSVTLRVANTDSNGLGIPLPAGTVRLFQNDVAGTLFLGQDGIGHTPKDETVSLTAGAAFDLVGERTEASRDQVSASTYRESYRITLRNHKTEAVTIAVVEHLPGSSWRILASSPTYESVDSSTIRFPVTVEAGGSSEVTYTVEYSY